MAYKRLSDRLSGTEADGPYEGIPTHMKAGVGEWFKAYTGSGNGGADGHAVRELASLLRRTLTKTHPLDQRAELHVWAEGSAERMLDLIDALLYLRLSSGVGAANSMRRILENAGSIWTVSEANEGLHRTVSEQAQATFLEATAVEDEISAELKEAWAHAFGRGGNSSDAWDHAIKAVEDLLIPLVCPKQDKANLGHVIGSLDKQGSLWRLCLPGNEATNDVAPLVAMLRLLWPNPDRHGGAAKRKPTPTEARSVVPLAAMLVQWNREGGIVTRRLVNK